MRKTYDSKFKSRVALEAMRGELTIAEIASKYHLFITLSQTTETGGTSHFVLLHQVWWMA